MSKAFIKENNCAQTDADFDAQQPAPSYSSKNYITPTGYANLQAELKQLLESERPQVVETVHWAAKNGDRSENGDYLYGKKRLREIDKRIRFLTKRLEIAEVIDASVHYGKAQVFFGATVTYENDTVRQSTITIVGVDEVDSLQNRISWRAPIARAILRAYVDDEIMFKAPAGVQNLCILDVQYPKPTNVD